MAASTFSEQMTAFRAQLLLADPVARYNHIGINRAFPRVLLSPDSLLPQTARYPLKDIRRLYQAATKVSRTLASESASDRAFGVYSCHV